MAACCGCAALKPRYKRLVDGIFPADPSEGLNKSNMDKLTFFAMKSPEKLDRIGNYLANRLSRDVSRQRIGFVCIAMEALDTLLVTCHAQSLNLFVESFLKMVTKLLESPEPDLQILATVSFVKFANIEEDTPSYHRRYDFFVSKFSSMSHNNDKNIESRNKLRVAGVQGLQGVVRKTVSDDLQVNIWEPQHMAKIIPSLLFNMEDQYRGAIADPESPKEEDNPSVVAENVFRDLICRASFGNINAVIRPVLTHLDNHKLWVPNEFAVKCFKIIMYSVQAQYGYVVVQMLMSHLDEHSKKDPKIRASIVDVLYETVLISAGGSIGPSVLEVFNTLLRHLRVSVDFKEKDAQRALEEKNFQEAIINTIGEFANNLPDYQKIEILMFVMGKVPMPRDEEGAGDSKDVMMQTMLMKTILKVATKYKTVLMANAFPNHFIEPLLRMSTVNDPGIRRIVQDILHTLLDRHDNISKLKHVYIPRSFTDLDLKRESPPRQDIMFMKKNGNLFYYHIYENIQKGNNKVDNFEALFTTMALLCIELEDDEIVLELIKLAITIQKTAYESNLAIMHKSAIHAMVAAIMSLLSYFADIPAFTTHVNSVIDMREKEAPIYLPEKAFDRMNTASSYPDSDEMRPNWRFDLTTIIQAWEMEGRDASKLDIQLHMKPPGLDTIDMGSQSVSDIQSINLSVDLDSTTSTPGMSRKFVHEDVTVDALKKVLENNPKVKEEKEKKRLEIYESFRSGPFEDIVARSEAKSASFNKKINDILDMISKPQESPGGTPRKPKCEEESLPIYELKFPELFVY